jgi:hypothetical protein
VAAVAVRANEIIVNVVGLVARKTFLWSVPMFLTIVVTGGAAYVRVTTEQLVICKVMIEVLFIQVNDVRIPTQMILMAACTAIFIRFPRQAVKPDFAVYVTCNVFVASKAELRLFAAIERQMAGATLRFDVRVSLYDLTRHDERFDLGKSVVGCDRC